MNPLIEGLLSVLYPPLCPCCNTVMTRGEGPMCLTCRMKLPLTANELSPTANDMIDKLHGLTPIESAAAYFRYRRESPQASLLHDMKYHGRPTIGRQLGAEFAMRLQQHGFFDNIDAIIPVPLSLLRHCRRGYNQSAWIARGVSRATSLPIVNALSAQPHRSQTVRNAADRQSATLGIYSAKPQALTGLNHVVIVDDICTTGSTLYACASAIHTAAPTVKISAIALASTTLLR